MTSECDPTWAYLHEGRYPSDNRAVSVLVIHKDGSFNADIGRWYGKRGGATGWNLNAYGEAPVVAWSNLPDFKDTTEVVEHD